MDGQVASAQAQPAAAAKAEPRDLSAFFPPGWQQQAAAHQLQLEVWTDPDAQPGPGPQSERRAVTTSSAGYNMTMPGRPRKKRRVSTVRPPRSPVCSTAVEQR